MPVSRAFGSGIMFAAILLIGLGLFRFAPMPFDLVGAILMLASLGQIVTIALDERNSR